MYKNCSVKITSDKTSSMIDYTTGVYQGGNMSPILFLSIMQAFLDSLKLNAEQVECSFFPKNKNGNLQNL